MKSSLFVALLALAVGAQAGEVDRTSSEALQIVKAAHYRELRDVTAGEIAAAQKKSSKGSAAAMAGIGIGTASGAFSPPPGLSPATATAFSAIEILNTFPAFQLESTARLLAWMPKSLASTPDEARDVLSRILVEAFKAAEPDLPVELVIPPPKSKVQNHVAIARPGCVNCIVVLKPLEEYVKPKLEKTPAVIGEPVEAWVWGEPNKQADGLLTDLQTLEPEDRVAFFRKVSAQLPPWMAIYLPADPEKYASYRQVLRQGRVLLFIEPAAAEVSTLANSDKPAG